MSELCELGKQEKKRGGSVMYKRKNNIVCFCV